jgi:hypothetical protein
LLLQRLSAINENQGAEPRRAAAEKKRTELTTAISFHLIIGMWTFMNDNVKLQYRFRAGCFCRPFGAETQGFSSANESERPLGGSMGGF